MSERRGMRVEDDGVETMILDFVSRHAQLVGSAAGSSSFAIGSFAAASRCPSSLGRGVTRVEDNQPPEFGSS